MPGITPGDTPGLDGGQGISAISVLLYWTGWSSSGSLSQENCDLWMCLYRSRCAYTDVSIQMCLQLHIDVSIQDAFLKHLWQWISHVRASASQSACGCGSVCATPVVPLKGLWPKDKSTLDEVQLKAYAALGKSMVQQVHLEASVVPHEVLRCNY